MGHLRSETQQEYLQTMSFLTARFYPIHWHDLNKYLISLDPSNFICKIKGLDHMIIKVPFNSVPWLLLY